MIIETGSQKSEIRSCQDDKVLAMVELMDMENSESGDYERHLGTDGKGCYTY